MDEIYDGDAKYERALLELHGDVATHMQTPGREVLRERITDVLDRWFRSS